MSKALVSCCLWHVHVLSFVHMAIPHVRGVNPLGILEFARTHPGAAISFGRPPLLKANTLALALTMARLDARDPNHAIAIDVLDRLLLSVAPRSMMLNERRLVDAEATELAYIKAALLVSIEQFVDHGLHTWYAFLPQPLAITGIEVVRHASKTYPLLRGPWPLHFWSSMAGLIEAAGHLLRRCARCETVFVQSGRSRYCTRSCSSRKRAAAYYQRHPKRILEQRRQRYEDAVREQQPRAKIQRRPRTTQGSKP